MFDREQCFPENSVGRFVRGNSLIDILWYLFRPLIDGFHLVGFGIQDVPTYRFPFCVLRGNDDVVTRILSIIKLPNEAALPVRVARDLDFSPAQGAGN